MRLRGFEIQTDRLTRPVMRTWKGNYVIHRFYSVGL
jgi:hypothetical protein